MSAIRPLLNSNLANANKVGKRILQSSIERIVPYLNSANANDKKVVKLRSPEEITQLFDFALNDSGCTYEHLMPEIDKILDYSVMTQHKHFHNQLFAQSQPEAVAGEIIAGFTNASMYTFEVAPVYLMIEKLMLEKMREKIGWTQGDGIFCPGGSLCNFYGMNLARYHKFPESKTEGMSACGRLAQFTNTAGHYSITKSAAFLGLGTNSIYSVDYDKNYGMCEKDLRIKIQKARNDGRTPFLINATCATTVFGSYDNLEMLAKVCEEEGMWLHQDAALGASVLMSEKHKHLMKGSELADSVTWNPHKMMGLPLQCSAINTKHLGIMHLANSANAAYLFQKDKLNIEHDTGDKSIQCGRKVDVQKFWMSYKVQGDKGYEERIDRMMEISKYLRDQIIKRGKEDGSFELVSEPYMTNVCFWYIPPGCRVGDVNAPEKWSEEWCDKVHEAPVKIKEMMQETGSQQIGFQKVPVWGHQSPPNFFRFALSNPYLEEKDIDFLLDDIEEKGQFMFGRKEGEKMKIGSK